MGGDSPPTDQTDAETCSPPPLTLPSAAEFIICKLRRQQIAALQHQLKLTRTKTYTAYTQKQITKNNRNKNIYSITTHTHSAFVLKKDMKGNQESKMIEL